MQIATIPSSTGGHRENAAADPALMLRTTAMDRNIKRNPSGVAYVSQASLACFRFGLNTARAIVSARMPAVEQHGFGCLGLGMRLGIACSH